VLCYTTYIERRKKIDRRTPQPTFGSYCPILREELLEWAETVDYQGKDKSGIVASSLENLADVAVEDHERCFKATVLFLIEDDELYQ